MCKSHCSTFILWAGHQGLECYIPVIIIIISFLFFLFFFFTHKHTYSPFWKEQRHIRTLVLCSCHPIFQRHFKQSTPSPEWSIFSISVFAGHKTSIVVSDFIRESRMTSGAYKWGLIIHTHTHTHTHTGSRTNWSPKRIQAPSHLPPSLPHKCAVLHAQMHIHPQKQSFFERESRGEGGREGRGARLAS